SRVTPILTIPFKHPHPSTPYTLSLHDALPISLHRDDEGHHQKWLHIVVRQTAAGNRERLKVHLHERRSGARVRVARTSLGHGDGDRKSIRLNSSHVAISYAVFCLKKKKVKI